MSPRRRMLLLAAVGGALMALCWLPFGLAPLLPLAILPALRGLRLAKTGRDALLFGLCFGAVRQAVGAHYVLALTSYSLLAPLLLLFDVLYIAPFAMAEAWGAFRLERRTGIPRTHFLVLLFPLLTWTRTLTDLSNPSDMLAGAFGTHPQWLAVTAWTGPYFISLVAMLAAALLDTAFETRRDTRRCLAWSAAAAVLWFALPLADPLVSGEAGPEPGATLRVGIVQPSVLVEEKLDQQRAPETWARLAKLTAQAAEGADLVLWPESTRPEWVTLEVGERFSDPPMEALSREVGAPILYGCQIAQLRQGSLVATYNGAALVWPDGRTGAWYGKQRLLPFVEGVPFAGWLGWDASERLRNRKRASHGYLSLMGNFSPGPELTVFEVGDARLGVLICYEALYPRLVRQYRAAGANALAVLTNDAWFGRTAFPRWHALVVAARAREADVPVIRAANSGVCSVTDRHGRMGPSTRLMEVTTLQVELEPSGSSATVYSRTGDVLIGVLAAVLGVLASKGAPPGERSARRKSPPGRGRKKRRKGRKS